MIWRIAIFVVAIFGFAEVSGRDSVGASNGVKVMYSGRCVVEGGIRTPSGAPVRAWEVWQEIFLTGSPTWLQAHTHRGAECVTSVLGVTSWWFAHGGASPSAPPTTVPVCAGRTIYTVQGRVHTAGDAGPYVQAYLGIHVLEQGTDFNYPVDDPSAPPVVKTSPVSIFKSKMPNQVPSEGTFTIANQMIALEPGATYAIAASRALGYYTVVGGGATMTIGGRQVTMALGKTIALPRNVPARIAATEPTMLAATELVPHR